MGRFLESLKQATPRRTAEDKKAAPTAAPAPVVNEDDLAEEEIPFIEVGPHKSMNASASVLATRPLAAAPAPVTLRPSTAESAPSRPHFAAETIAHHQPDDAASGQYRELLAALTPAVADEETAILLLAPALPGADAAAVLLNLAVTAARQGRRVAVVDADPRRAIVAERLGLSLRPGLSDVLSGGAALQQALQPVAQANLFVLTAGAPAPAGPRLVVETTASVLRQLRQRCDLMFVLGSIWDGGPECSALAAVCGVVYLVLPEQEAGSARLDELLQTIPRHGARLGGCILAAG